MEIYIIIALAFAIMYHVRYIREIIHIVKGVAQVHDAEGDFSDTIFSITSFITIFAFAPLFALPMLWKDRQTVIKTTATEILVKYYDLDYKK